MALWLRRPGDPPPASVTGLVFTAEDRLDWAGTGGSTSYDVVRGDLMTLRAQRSFTPAVNACLENNGADLRASEPGTPASGQGFWYLVRGVSVTGMPGPYAVGAARERPGRDAEIAAAGGECP